MNSYAFDHWLERNIRHVWFERYADDAVIHCRTRQEAEFILERVRQRLKDCGLTLHPEKTKLVYCMDEDRPEKHENTSFDFLSYTFRPVSPRVAPWSSKNDQKQEWKVLCQFPARNKQCFGSAYSGRYQGSGNTYQTIALLAGGAGEAD